MTTMHLSPDPDHDLLLERVVDLPREAIWRAWTTPELLVQWFTPAPWSTVSCEIELHPGGAFRTVMRSPEGTELPMNTGCVLEVVEHEKLAWTGALKPGFRPLDPRSAEAQDAPFLFSAVITLEPHPEGTLYRALAIHSSAEGKQKHEAMGFLQGWGAALDQLVALMKRTTG